MRHLNSVSGLPRADIDEIFRRASVLKAGVARGKRPPLLAGLVLTQVFEKPSLRTRVSFEAAMMQLGGSSLFLNSSEAGFGGREAVQDVARVLGVQRRHRAPHLLAETHRRIHQVLRHVDHQWSFR